MSLRVRDELDDCPPSHALVWLVLRDSEQPLRHRELVDRTPAVTGRTVCRALRALREQGLVERQGDAPTYTVNRQNVGGD